MRIPGLILLLLLVTPSAAGEIAIIKIDIAKRTVDPPSPVVNIAAADAIEILVVENDTPVSNLDKTVVARLLSGPVYKDENESLKRDDGLAEFTGNPLAFNTIRCSWKQSARARRSDRRNPESPLVPCPATILSGGVVTLHAVDATITVEVTVRSAKPTSLGVAISSKPSNTEGLEFRMNVPIQLIARGSQLFWSAGLTWLDGIRDEAYDLRPIEGDPEHLRLIDLGDESAEYRLGANAHYRFSRTRPFWNMYSAIFGVATTVPTEDLGAYLGVAISPPVWPFDDGGHLFIGYGYAKAARLANQFQGLTTVPADTKLSDLTSDEHDYGLVFGVSFTFFGGKDQFKAAFPGQAAGKREEGE